VARLGLLKIAVVTGGGLGGALARQRVGGDEATHVGRAHHRRQAAQLHGLGLRGHGRLIDEVERRSGKPCEALTAGALGVGQRQVP
jgi:hypothetical protein